MNVSDALPIQFWPNSSQTFNERINAFVDQICFFQEYGITDPIKLQVSNEADTDEKYWLQIKDSDLNQVDLKPFIKTLQTGYAHYDLTFDMSLLTSVDAYFSFSILRGDVSVFDESFDITFTDPFLTTLYNSDLIRFSTFIKNNAGYGTFVIEYKTLGDSNFAGINYPNDGNYFALRIPCRFFEQRNKQSQAAIHLSNSKVINTSIIINLQQNLETSLLPDYMHNKIQLALAHSVRGSLVIDGYEWILEESYDRNNPDKKNPFKFGKIFLSRKNSVIRNII